MSMDNNDLWAAALNTLSEEDRNLVAFDGQHKLDVLSDLGQLVDNAKENSIKKRWRFHRPGGGQTVILRDLFSKIVVWIDRFKEIGDIVVQYDPVHAALPWAGVRFLLQLAVSDVNTFAFLVEGAETIARNISRYATFEHIYLGYDNTATRAVKGLKEALVKLYAAILIYLGKAKKYFEERTPKRMAKSMITFQSSYEALLRNIDRELANVDRHAGLVDAEHSNDISGTLLSLSIDQREMYTKLRQLLRSIDSPICRMSRQLNSLEDELKHSQRVEILRWLSPQPYMDHHQQIKKQALRGSGQWLLQDPLYVQWYEQSVSSLLWLRGKPGSGKSTLVSLVIEDMIKRFEAGQSALPAYFYCTRSTAEPERSDPHAVLASILRQLSCVKPGAPILSPVIKQYKRQGEGFKSNGLDLDDSRDLIIRLIEDYSMTIIVVDALDECDPVRRQNLLDAFEHILKESVGLVKIFVSSRNDQDIVYTLREYPNMEISSDKNTADIKAYVETETMRLVRTGQLLRNSRAKEKMTASIMKKISGGADGMFRWASLQLDVLRALKRDEDIQARLGRLPPKLEQLYLELYNNLISAQGGIGRSIIDNTLKWLLCAQKELCAADFLTAVAANLNISDENISVDSLLELCNNFVIYDEGLDVFRFAHLSVREFLEHMPEFTKVPCYSLAAESCLMQIIASSNCPNTEHLMTNVHLHRLRGSPISAETPSSARFLEYANDLWIKYCQSIPLNDRSEDTNFGRLFHFFLSDKLGSNAPLNVWVQWYCSRVLDTDSASSLKLQDLLTICSDPLPRLFFVAIFSGFSEIATSCLRDRVLSDEMKDRGLLLAAMAAQHEIFALISEGIDDWVMTEPLLFQAACAFDKGMLRWLLDKARDAMITPHTFLALAEDWDDGEIAILLDRYPDLKITKEILEVAVENASLDNFGRLVARAVKPAITEDMLGIPPPLTKTLAAYSEKISILLDRMRGSELTPDLMGYAARHSDEQIMEAMLKKGGASIIDENVMVIAVQRGREILQLMLEYGGNLTDTVLDRLAFESDVQAWEVLLEQGYASSINAKTLKLAALNFLHGDALLSLLLDYADSPSLASEMAGLIREVARMGQNDRIRQLLNHTKDVTISQDMLLAACFNRSINRLGRVQMFLERSSELQSTEDMLVIAASDEYQGIELMQTFLDRQGEANISEYVLMAAACNKSQGYQIMQLLLEHDRVHAITEDVLICAAQYSSPDLVLNILERSEAKVVTGRLLEAAAKNDIHGGDLVKLLLARAEVTEFPEDVFIAAVGNIGNGMEMITVLEKRFGRVNGTENLMAKCIHRAGSDAIELLLSRTDPAKLTKEILIHAMSDPPSPYHVRRFVAEKSLHVPITIEILMPVAQYGDSNLFRFLWNRCRRFSVPEDLINAAAKNGLSGDGHTIFSFLLHEVDCVEIGEETLLAIAANWSHACDFFDLLLDQGLQADTTEGVPKTLLMNGGIKVKCSLPTPLQLSRCTKVTETMFKIAASRGDEEFLEKLTEFCGLESTPEIWLEIARLCNVVESGDNNLLKTLLERGVEPDVADPNGETSLEAAAVRSNEEAVRMLLSAGASPNGGSNLERSPLCLAAENDDYDMVKILVNAGASLDFKNDKGQTPSMIAKSSGHILIFKYLEQSKMQQERVG